MAEKRVSVRFSASGGKEVKSEAEGIRLALHQTYTDIERQSKSAAGSADVFTAAIEQQEAEFRALRASLDPVFAAQARYEAQVATTSRAVALGAATQADANRVMAQAQTVLDQAVSSYRTAGPSIDAFNKALAEEQRAFTALRASLDPAFAAVRRFEEAQEAAQRAVARGAATQEEANAVMARAKDRLLAAGGATEQAARLVGQSMGGARVDAANLGYQFQDIGVMLAAGQSPLMLAVQQGSQISQVLGPMGARGAVTALGSAFVGVFNPMTFAIIAVIAAGATMVQWLMDTGDEAKDLTETMDKLRQVTDQYRQANDALSQTPTQLAEKYGINIAQARELLESERELARVRALAGIDQAGADVSSKLSGFGGASSTEVREAIRLRQELAEAQGRVTEAAASGDRMAEGQARADLSALMERSRAYTGLQAEIEDLVKTMGGEAGPAADRLAIALSRVDEAIDPQDKVRAWQELRQAFDANVTEGERLGGVGLEISTAINQGWEEAMKLARVDLAKPFDEAALAAARLQEAVNSLDYSNGRRVANAAAGGGLTPAGAFDANLAGERAASALEAASNGIVALIRHMEGTEGAGGFNTTLGNGMLRPEGSDAGAMPLTSMTLRQILELQRQMLRNPLNAATYGQPSSALGVGQFTGTTLGGEGLTGRGGLIGTLNLSLDEVFTPELQMRLVDELVRQRLPQGANGFQQEWEGLQKVPDHVIQQALQGSSVAPIDPGVQASNAALAARAAAAITRGEAEAAAKSEAARKAEAAAAEAAASAYQSLRAALAPMAAASQAFEAGQATLDEALARNIITTDEYTAALAKLQEQRQASEVGVAVDNILAGTPDLPPVLNDVNDALAQSAQLGRDVFGGIIDDMRAGASAGEMLAGVLDKIASRMIDMSLDSLFGTGDVAGPLAGMFGGMFGGAPANISTAPLSAIPSFDGGGYTGSGSRSGGIDGKGGYLSIVHPEEIIGDLTKVRRRGTAGGGADGGGAAIKLEVVSRIDPDNGNIGTFVERVSGAQVRASETRQAKQLPGRVAKINRDPRNRGRV